MLTGHARIIDILVRRDEITLEEAREQVEETVILINESIESGGSYCEVEDILAGELGLEMDYIFDLLML